jgi:hypothetical protein
MIPASRFMANKEISETDWENARRRGITATEVAKAATNAGFAETVEKYSTPEPFFDNAYMEFGRRWEKPIALVLKERLGIMPNDWVIAGENLQHLATPDGLSLDHRTIAEIKTTGRDWDTIPIGYRRQVQWQLHVTGAETCTFAWLLREERTGPDGNSFFVPGWFEPKLTTIEKDEKMIADLTDVAERLWEIKQTALGSD